MEALVVYDSVYGNTEKIARAIGGAVSGEVKVLRPGEVAPSDLQSLDLLMVGAPTQGGRATQPIQDFLNELPESLIKGLNVAAFDTRISGKDRDIGVRVLIGVIGYAAGRIANSLKDKGGHLVAPPEGFLVKGTEGPLKEGELERAAIWVKGIMEKKR